MSIKPFVLAVKAVVLDRRGRCLLLRRSSRNRSFVGCWEWPGGAARAREHFTRAILRETLEETGLEIDLTSFVGAVEFETPDKRVVMLCMEARAKPGAVILSHEHDAWQWTPLRELSQWTLPQQIRGFMLDYARRRRRRNPLKR